MRALGKRPEGVRGPDVPLAVRDADPHLEQLHDGARGERQPVQQHPGVHHGFVPPLPALGDHREHRGAQRIGLTGEMGPRRGRHPLVAALGSECFPDRLLARTEPAVPQLHRVLRRRGHGPAQPAAPRPHLTPPGSGHGEGVLVRGFPGLLGFRGSRGGLPGAGGAPAVPVAPETPAAAPEAGPPGAPGPSTDTYPLRSFSPITFARYASAPSAEPQSFSWVRPCEPIRPYRTVTTAPAEPASQNLAALPSSNSQRRMSAPPLEPAGPAPACSDPFHPPQRTRHPPGAHAWIPPALREPGDQWASP